MREHEIMQFSTHLEGRIGGRLNKVSQKEKAKHMDDLTNYLYIGNESKESHKCSIKATLKYIDLFTSGAR